jgi:hypothetical protein
MVMVTRAAACDELSEHMQVVFATPKRVPRTWVSSTDLHKYLCVMAVIPAAV